MYKPINTQHMMKCYGFYFIQREVLVTTSLQATNKDYTPQYS